MTDITFNGGSMHGVVRVPSSKSHTHRTVILSCLSGGGCTVHSPLISADTLATIDAMRSMGAVIDVHGDRIVIGTSRLNPPDRPIDVGNSGTTLRLLSGISALFDSETVLTGDASIRRRPMGPLMKSLEDCGAICDSNGGCAPLKIRGPITGSRLAIDGGISSQFVSSVLIASPLIGRPVDIEITGRTVSKPYIDITLSMMREFGVDVSVTERGFHVEPQSYRPVDYTVPADFSSSAFPLVAGGLAGDIEVTGLDTGDMNGDGRIIDILREAGCSVTMSGNSATCRSNGRPRPLDLDMSDTPDLFPVACVLLSTADGTSRIHGAHHLRFKESDRISSTVRMLKALGADIEGTDDGCIIRGVERLHGGRVEHEGDHRILMAAAIASLVADGPVTMEDDGCWNVSFPGFPETMRSIGMRC